MLFCFVISKGREQEGRKFQLRMDSPNSGAISRPCPGDGAADFTADEKQGPGLSWASMLRL